MAHEANARRILAKLTLQRWEKDEALTVEEREIDVTERVLLMPPNDIRALRDNGSSSDEVCRWEATRWGGPFEVVVTESICDYFEVGEVSEITDQMVADAKVAQGLDHEAEYEVEVERISTRRMTIKVKALSADDARDKALRSAPDQDFYRVSEADANYEFVQASRQEAYAQPRRNRP